MLLWWTSAVLAGTLDGTPLTSVTLRFDSRYDTIAWGDDESRLQNSALVAFRVETFAEVDLVGMASTGDDFTSRWSTWRDLNGGDADRMALSLRHLYLQRWFGPVRVQAGSITPVKGAVSASGLEDLGWIDGARVEVHVGDGVVEAVGGSLFDVGEPDLFIRRRRLNYGEVEVSWGLPLGFEAEGAFHVLGRRRYAKAEAGWSWRDDTCRGVTVRAEGSVELTGGGTLAVGSAETDVLCLATGDDALADRLTALLRCRWVDPDYGRLGTLSEDFYQLGGECMVRADGRIDDAGILSWNVRYIAPVTRDLAPRFDVGITVKLRADRDEDAPPRR